MRPGQLKQLTQGHTANKQPEFELGSSGFLYFLLPLQNRLLSKNGLSSGSNIGGGLAPVSCTCLEIETCHQPLQWPLAVHAVTRGFGFSEGQQISSWNISGQNNHSNKKALLGTGSVFGSVGDTKMVLIWEFRIQFMLSALMARDGWSQHNKQSNVIRVCFGMQLQLVNCILLRLLLRLLWIPGVYTNMDRGWQMGDGRWERTEVGPRIQYEHMWTTNGWIHRLSDLEVISPASSFSEETHALTSILLHLLHPFSPAHSQGTLF